MKRILILTTIVAIAVTAFATAPSQRGQLVVIGGGRITNDILERMGRYTGGVEGSRVLIVPYSMPVHDTAYHARNVKRFKDYGYKHVDLINCLPEDLDLPENLAKLDGVNVIFFGGGLQDRLANALHGTKFLERIRELHEAGATVAGTSAGAAVMSKVMIVGGQRQVPEGFTHANYALIVEDNVNLGEGFGFMPDVLIHQHFVVRRRLTTLFSALLDHPYLLGVGIDEHTAIDVSPDGSFEVVGDSSVMILDPIYKPGESPRFDVLILWNGEKHDGKKAENR